MNRAQGNAYRLHGHQSIIHSLQRYHFALAVIHIASVGGFCTPNESTISTSQEQTLSEAHPLWLTFPPSNEVPSIPARSLHLTHHMHMYLGYTAYSHV